MKFVSRAVVMACMLAPAALLWSGSAQAQFAKPEDAIKYRKAAYTVMGTHFGRIGAMVQNRIPFNAQQAQMNAEIVEMASKLPFDGFVAGSNQGDTRAKAEIWSQADKFKTANDNMVRAVAALNVAAKTGNADNLRAAFGQAGQTCKACHDDFRRE
jgi:cytochrome c556